MVINGLSIVFAYIYSENIPTRTTWQKAIDSLDVGISLELGSAFDPLKDGQRCICTLNGCENEGVFTLYNGSVKLDESSDENRYSLLAQERDFYFMFKGGGAVGSNLCICILCQALIGGFDSVVSPDGLNRNMNDHLLESIELLLCEYNAKN